MEQFRELLISLLTGLLTGFVASMPIGPVNITIVNEAARRGFLRAWLVGLGAVTMDAIYCGIGLAGFAQLFKSREVQAAMELVSFLLVTYLGIKYLRVKSIERSSATAEVIERKLHPHTAYMTGFVRVLGNPGVLVFWVMTCAVFLANEWVDPDTTSKVMCVLGVTLGAGLWFAGLSYAVSKRKGQLSEKALVRMSQISGICLLAGALVIFGKLVVLVARR